MLTDQPLYDMVVDPVNVCMNLGQLRCGILVYVVYVQCRSVRMRFTEYSYICCCIIVNTLPT